MEGAKIRANGLSNCATKMVSIHQTYAELIIVSGIYCTTLLSEIQRTSKFVVRKIYLRNDPQGFTSILEPFTRRNAFPARNNSGDKMKVGKGYQRQVCIW